MQNGGEIPLLKKFLQVLGIPDKKHPEDIPKGIPKNLGYPSTSEEFAGSLKSKNPLKLRVLMLSRNSRKVSTEPKAGIGPATYALRGRCSTPELLRRYKHFYHAGRR